ncbi:MAG: hypothetical protein EBR28_00745 [Planctomycetia bacterium]|nr:hypothetical protein [Planctomycetia bacterium]
MRWAALLSLAMAGLVVSTAELQAGDAALTVAYGNGVHAFNDGDYQCSYDELSGVIEAGANDARAYYFRGLAALKLGRLDEAEADFQQGAGLEAEGRSGVGSHAISLALERVQGCDRIKLEQYRGRARVAALQRERDMNRRRYSDIEDAEAEVLRKRRPERIAPAESVPAPEAKAEADAEPKPEADEPPPAERMEREKPAAKPGDAVNPFADEPAER